MNKKLIDRKCPMCHEKLYTVEYSCGYRVVCLKGCLNNVLTLNSKTREDAVEALETFITELNSGADIWGSKIRDGVAE